MLKTILIKTFSTEYIFLICFQQDLFRRTMKDTKKKNLVFFIGTTTIEGRRYRPEQRQSTFYWYDHY